MQKVLKKKECARIDLIYKFHILWKFTNLSSLGEYVKYTFIFN